MSRRSDVPSLPDVGARARLRRSVERFPHFVAEAGAAGTITGERGADRGEAGPGPAGC